MPLFVMEARRSKVIGQAAEVVYRWFTRSAVLANMFTEIKGYEDNDGTVNYFAVYELPEGQKRPPIVLVFEDIVNDKLNEIRRERGWL